MRRWLAGVVVGVSAAAGLLVAGLALVGPLGIWDGPFERRHTTTSTPALLQAVRDLRELHLAEGTYQVVLQEEERRDHVPSVLAGRKTTYQAVGTVDALVDLANLDAAAVTLSPDGQTATLHLPAVRLGAPRLDLERSKVLDRDRGVLDRAADAVGEGIGGDAALQQAATDRLAAAAAADPQLRSRAEAGARTALTELAQRLGVKTVVVVVAAPPTAGLGG